MLTPMLMTSRFEYILYTSNLQFDLEITITQFRSRGRHGTKWKVQRACFSRHEWYLAIDNTLLSIPLHQDVGRIFHYLTVNCGHMSRLRYCTDVPPLFFVKTATFAIDLRLVSLELTKLPCISADALRYRTDGDGLFRTAGIDKMFLVKSFNARYRPAQLRRRALDVEPVRTTSGRSVSQPKEI
jgi:hypothetical protein